MMMRYQSRMHPTLDILCDSMGRVFNKTHWTFGNLNHYGYRTVRINGKTYKVARLICETFHGLAPNDGLTADHIDRNRDSNVPENLRWLDKHGQNNNRQVCYDSLKKYGVRKCENPRDYQRAYRANNPEVVEQERARERERYAKNPEKCCAHQREYQAKQKALGKRRRRCPDGKQHWLTNEEYDKRFG